MGLSSRDVHPIESQLKGANERQHITVGVQCGKVSMTSSWWHYFFVDYYKGHSIIFARFAPCLLFELNILLL